MIEITSEPKAIERGVYYLFLFMYLLFFESFYSLENNIVLIMFIVSQDTAERSDLAYLSESFAAPTPLFVVFICFRNIDQFFFYNYCTLLLWYLGG